MSDYTNRRKVQINTADLSKSNEEREIENQLEFENMCARIQECSITKIPVIHRSSSKLSNSASTSALTASTSPCNHQFEVQEFQRFLDANGGHYGNWKVKDHLFFLKTKSKYPLNETADIVNKNFPDISVEKVLAHASWYKEYVRLRNARKRAIEDWRQSHKQIMKTEKKPIPEPTQKTTVIKRDPNLKEKIETWKAYTQTAKQKRLEEFQKGEMRKKEEEEERKKKQNEKRAEVNKYREEKINYELAMKTAGEVSKMQEKHESLQKSAVLLKYFRYEDRRFTERQRAKIQQKRIPKEIPKRKSSAEAKRDPNRLLQPTTGWLYHTKKEKTEFSQGPMFIQHVRKLGKPEWRKELSL